MLSHYQAESNFIDMAASRELELTKYLVPMISPSWSRPDAKIQDMSQWETSHNAMFSIRSYLNFWLDWLYCHLPAIFPIYTP